MESSWTMQAPFSLRMRRMVEFVEWSPMALFTQSRDAEEEEKAVEAV